MRKKSAVDALMPPVRQRVLSFTFRTPDRWWYLSELAGAIGTSPSSLQRELDSLSSSGILLMRRDGRRTYYRPNENSAIYPELKALVRKTMGIPQEVGDAIAPLAKKIVLALVYGSVARGDERADSDVDLLIVSDDLTLEEVYKRLAPAEKRLHRKINPTVYSPEEFRKRRTAKNHFLERVLAGEHVCLLGDLNAAAGA
jgi:predicted nucleotidyltransferase